MFSPRLIAALALVAAVAAYPADQEFIPRPITTLTDADFEDASSWWSFPSLDAFFAPLWKLFPNFSEIGPRIEVDDDKFRVVVNIKGYKKDDLKVKLKNQFMFIQGAHEAKDTDHDLFASQFFHTYSLPPNASASDVTASLYTDGYLVITAPLKGSGEKTQEAEVEVPISEIQEPFKKEAVGTNRPNVSETAALPEVPVVAVEEDNKGQRTTSQPTTADDTKEPTTSSDREEVTEKNNLIPHGQEALEANELNEVQP